VRTQYGKQNFNKASAHLKQASKSCKQLGSVNYSEINAS
jgi:hypothetical protein